MKQADGPRFSIADRDESGYNSAVTLTTPR